MQKISKKQFLAIITGLLLISLLVWAGWFRSEDSNRQAVVSEKSISLQATLKKSGLPGAEVLKSFASMENITPQKTTAGFEIQDSLQNSSSESAEKNNFKIKFPVNYNEHISLTLAPGKVITIIDKNASSATGRLLSDQNNPASPSYVEYKKDDRKIIYYAYQKNKVGAQKLKNWILYQSGDGKESESYQFENAKIVLDSKKGNADIAYVDKTGNPKVIMPLQIPKPFFIDKDGIRIELDWKLNKAGDTLSVELATTPDKYPIVLDPTIIPSQFSMIGTVSMKGAVKFVTNGERTAYVAPNPFAPVNTAIPPLFGTAATVGGTILAAPGVWTGTPTPTYSYQWQRGTTDIGGATNSTYVAQSADAGSTLRVVVTGTNSVGNATGTSANTSAVTMAPANTAVPTISGTATVGATLSATAGSWTGYPAPTYTYQWQVQQDIYGLIKLMGGREKFTATLDQLFREDLGRSKFQFWAKFADATGMVGQFSMGNEPSFHIPWLYNYSGEPWKTQKRVRFLLDVWFQDNIFGIPGDEDGGGMTAFVVFASMGFYPVTPGLPVYNIGSPVFEEVKIKLANGKTFSILAHNYAKGNKYIQSAKLNGQPLNRPWFTHTDLLNGATIELEMGAYPNKKWGSASEDAPPSSID